MPGEARRAAALAIICVAFACMATAGCGPKDVPPEEGSGCATPLVDPSAGTKGQSFVFDPEPMESDDDHTHNKL